MLRRKKKEKRTKKARNAKKGSSYFKKKAWEAFSRYIRLKYADKEGNVVCVTCGAIKPWDQMQAGHFVPGRTGGILFDERGVHPQCVRCNIFLRGNLIEYYPFMLKTYGETIVNELRALKTKNVQFKSKDYEEILNKYTNNKYTNQGAPKI